MSRSRPSTRLRARVCSGNLLTSGARPERRILFVTHSVDEAAFLGDEVHVFGARPASIRETVAIGLPRPRDVTTPAFAEIVRRLRRAIDSSSSHANEATA